MNTVNIVLMVVLSAMIGFAIGNAWGKESMKRTLTGILDQMTKNLSAVASKGTDEKKGA